VKVSAAREYAGSLRLAFEWCFRSFEITIMISDRGVMMGGGDDKPL